MSFQITWIRPFLCAVCALNVSWVTVVELSRVLKLHFGFILALLGAVMLFYGLSLLWDYVALKMERAKTLPRAHRILLLLYLIALLLGNIMVGFLPFTITVHALAFVAGERNKTIHASSQGRAIATLAAGTILLETLFHTIRFAVDFL